MYCFIIGIACKRGGPDYMKDDPINLFIETSLTYLLWLLKVQQTIFSFSRIHRYVPCRNCLLACSHLCINIYLCLTCLRVYGQYTSHGRKIKDASL